MRCITLILEFFYLSLQALKERIERLKARGCMNLLFTTQTEFSDVDGDKEELCLNPWRDGPFKRLMLS